MSKEVMNVSVDVLKVHPRNTEFFDDISGKDYEQFKQSIQEEGILSPILVSPDMTIISGHQRTKAAKELGINLVPVIIREDLIEEDNKLKVLLAANFGRTKNDPVKQRKVAVEYVNLCGLKDGENKKHISDKKTLSEIASQLGFSETSLKELLLIERKLTPEIKEILDSGGITKTTASKILIKLSSTEQEELISDLDTTKKYTQNEIEKILNNKKTRKPIPHSTIKTLLSRSNNKCEICGYGGDFISIILQYHHVTPYNETQDNSLDNLIVVCPNCHSLIHTIMSSDDECVKNGILESIQEIHSDRIKNILKLRRIK